MDIFFHDLSEVPLPPPDVHIRTLQAEPYADGRRVRVSLEISSFQKRPSIDLSILDRDDRVLASTSVVETITRRIQLTMHLRGSVAAGDYILEAVLFFTDPLTEPEEGEPVQLPEPVVVDQKRVAFRIEPAVSV